MSPQYKVVFLFLEWVHHSKQFLVKYIVVPLYLDQWQGQVRHWVKLAILLAFLWQHCPQGKVSAVSLQSKHFLWVRNFQNWGWVWVWDEQLLQPFKFSVTLLAPQKGCFGLGQVAGGWIVVEKWSTQIVGRILEYNGKLEPNDIWWAGQLDSTFTLAR